MKTIEEKRREADMMANITLYNLFPKTVYEKAETKNGRFFLIHADEMFWLYVKNLFNVEYDLAMYEKSDFNVVYKFGMDYVGLQIEVDKRLFTNVHCIYIVFRFSKEEDKMFDDVAYYLNKDLYDIISIVKNLKIGNKSYSIKVKCKNCGNDVFVTPSVYLKNENIYC